STGSDVEQDPAARLLKKSLAAYRARQANNENWVESRVKSAIAAREEVELPEEETWLRHVAEVTGLAIGTLKGLTAILDSAAFHGTTAEAVGALFEWLSGTPENLMHLVRPENLEGLFGEAYKKLPTDKARAEMALATIADLLPIWMSGAPLRDLEAKF